jgi:hypothetical protein
MAPLGPNKRMELKERDQIGRGHFAELDAHYWRMRS